MWSRQNVSIYIFAAIVLLNFGYSIYERKKSRAEILSTCLQSLEGRNTFLEKEVSRFFDAARTNGGKIDSKDLDRIQELSNLVFKDNHATVEFCQKMFQ